MKCALRVPMACTARIAGSEGIIELPAFMHCPSSLTVRTPAGEEQIDAAWEGGGLRFQVDEVHRCLDAGLRESPRMANQARGRLRRGDDADKPARTQSFGHTRQIVTEAVGVEPAPCKGPLASIRGDF